ncbi:uncharacterized protein LOC119576731 [Penaeus monodon]|uniref:uncharacterized protein LOC119576731 n=1 Tax=Penaeus monodon TaxID=6687 RepID=UPI0018A786E7|nr:uncharacterized protein LOC119576731 [Penaeus monodon]
MSRDMFSVIIASLKSLMRAEHTLSNLHLGNQIHPGLKIFVLASSDGQVLDFEFFQGKEDLLLSVQRTGLHLPEWGTLKIGEAAVLRFVKNGATGAMKKNLVPKECRLKTENQLKRSGRGSSDCARWCKREKRHLEVQRPRVVELYNLKMGGVDIIDQVISYYRSATRSAKFTVRAMLHLLDLSCANAWLEYRKDCEKSSSVAMDKVLNDDNSESDISEEHADISRKRTRPLPTAAKRTNSACHMPDALPPYASRMRCRYPGCNGRTKFSCKSCKSPDGPNLGQNLKVNISRTTHDTHLKICL